MGPESGFVVWFTGLSGSGKSTLAAMLAAELAHRGAHVEKLDGDEVRTHLSKGLGFSREDRDTNIRRIGFVAKLLARAGACAITAAISPFREVRDEQRRAIGRFCEVYCECPIDALAERDAKGLYKKALAGELRHFTGVDDPYEAPSSPEVTVRTDRETREESLARIVAKLEDLGYVPRAAGLHGAVLRSLVQPHGGELVDRLVRGAAREQLVERARSMPAVVLDARGASDVELVASGAFSPLTGFMTEKDYRKVVRDLRLEAGLVWPVPITLAISRAQADAIGAAGEVALVTADGALAAVLEVGDRFTPDKALEAERVFGTSEREHPGVAALWRAGEVYLGGELRVVEPGDAASPLPRAPRATRAWLEERGWVDVVGLAASGPMLRATEHLTKCALDSADALLVSLPDPEAGDDERLRLRSYELVLDRYYARARTLIAIYPGGMRHAGPREALLGALVSKNHGCSRVILERPRVGAILDGLSPGELGFLPLLFDEPFFSAATGATATARTAPDAPAPQGDVAAIERRLLAGEALPEGLVRPEVARLYAEAARRP